MHCLPRLSPSRLMTARLLPRLLAVAGMVLAGASLARADTPLPPIANGPNGVADGPSGTLPSMAGAAMAGAVVVHPALWRLSRGAATVYLFGTVHALPPGVGWFAGPVASAFSTSGELVTEIIDRSPEEMRGIVAARALLPQGQSLRVLLSRADRVRYERTLRANGLPVDAFDRFRPWYAAVALSTRPLLASGYDPARGADEDLSARAASEARRHEALETPEYQLGLFAALPTATQLRYLREVVRDLPQVQHDLRAMVRAWETGDAARLARLMNEDNDDPHMRETLLVGRNKAWARWIKARMSRPGTVFVAVGAGHLAGRDSVQAQLAAMGLTAVRVQ